MRDATSNEIKRDRQRLGNPYAHLGGDGKYSAVVPDENSQIGKGLRLDAPTLREGLAAHHPFSDFQIERIAKTTQLALWSHRTQSGPKKYIESPIDVLDSVAALKGLGYSFETLDTLGQFSDAGELVETAGVIDGANKSVQISMHFPQDVRNFTAAHELGHALLHEGLALHRDRSVESTHAQTRNRRERQADKFASYFLMPEKQVRNEFARRYGVSESLPLDEATAFYLDVSLSNLRTMPKRDLSRLLAGVEKFGGNHFDSLARRFGVSIEAMAIRLEEIELLVLR